MQLDLLDRDRLTAYPPARRATGSEVYDLLRANHFAEARDEVRTWRSDNTIRHAIEAGDYQGALCALGVALFPRNGGFAPRTTPGDPSF